MLENVEMNQQIESEKQEIDKLLIEIRETKETLIKFNEDLEKAIAAECHIEGALKAIAGSCENIVNGICNAIETLNSRQRSLQNNLSNFGSS